MCLASGWTCLLKHQGFPQLFCCFAALTICSSEGSELQLAEESVCLLWLSGGGGNLPDLGASPFSGYFSTPFTWKVFNWCTLLVGGISSVPELQHTQGQQSSSSTITFLYCLCTFKTFLQASWDPKTPEECELASSIRHGGILNHFSLNCFSSPGQQWFHNSYSAEWNEGKMQI